LYHDIGTNNVPVIDAQRLRNAEEKETDQDEDEAAGFASIE
jgi:hypothetical protein